MTSLRQALISVKLIASTHTAIVSVSSASPICSVKRAAMRSARKKAEPLQPQISLIVSSSQESKVTAARRERKGRKSSKLRKNQLLLKTISSEKGQSLHG